MNPTSLLRGLAGGAFVLALPVLFGTLSLRWLVSDVGVGFGKYGISVRTGISPADLERSAAEISRYLLLARDNIDISVHIGNELRPLFSDRELRHMADVQNLFRGFFLLQGAAGGYVVLYLGGSWLRRKRGYWGALGRKLQWGGGLTLGLFALFGVASVLDFEKLFLEFHLISFSNDLWMLDPTRDNLIMMFPQGFWYDSAIRLAEASGAQALAATVLGTMLNSSG